MKMIFAMSLIFISLKSLAMTIQDLTTLTKNREYTEALAHMKDTAPGERNDDWKKLVKEASLGQLTKLKDQKCSEAYYQSKSYRIDFPSLDLEQDYKKFQVTLGICLIKKRQYGSVKEREDVVDELVRIDPKVLYPLIFEADYNDPHGRFNDYLKTNPNDYAKDERVKEYKLKNTQIPTPVATTEGKSASKVDQKRLQEALMQEYSPKMKLIADQVMKGDFGNDHKGYELHYKMKAFDLPFNDDLETARFVVAQLIVATNTHERLVETLQKLRTGNINQAVQELISTKLSQPFWFSGGGWDSPEKKELLKSYFAPVVLEAKKECAEFEKNNKKEPPHVSSFNCPLLKTL